MDEIQIITPPIADETQVLDFSLVALTEAIGNLNTDAVAHGFLGGEFGYGADYENDIFMMHHYCWCEDPHCPWCAGCYCADNSLRDCEKSSDGEKCSWCKGEHRWADKGALRPDDPPHCGAPHFWHKASGFRVWWYKWIGRDMEIVNSTNADVASVFRECMASLQGIVK